MYPYSFRHSSLKNNYLFGSVIDICLKNLVQDVLGKKDSWVDKGTWRSASNIDVSKWQGNFTTECVSMQLVTMSYQVFFTLTLHAVWNWWQGSKWICRLYVVNMWSSWPGMGWPFLLYWKDSRIISMAGGVTDLNYFCVLGKWRHTYFHINLNEMKMLAIGIKLGSSLGNVFLIYITFSSSI